MPRLIVGLGNPGPEYEATRHNIGFMVLDRLRARLRGDSEPQHTADSLVWSRQLRGQRLWLQKPLTYMNLSGPAVARVARQSDCQQQQVLVVYDDLDLPLGRLRLRGSGSSGGHRGMESIIAALGGNDFPRLRVGIGRSDQTVIKHVLEAFAETELALAEAVLDGAVEALLIALHRGLGAAMNQFNGIDFGAPAEDEDA